MLEAAMAVGEAGLGDEGTRADERPPSVSSRPSEPKLPPLVSPDGEGMPPRVSPDGEGIPPLVSPDGEGIPPLVSPDGEGMPLLVSPDGDGMPPLVSVDGKVWLNSKENEKQTELVEMDAGLPTDACGIGATATHVVEAVRAEAPTIPCPTLLIGSKFQQVCKLKANHWMMIGRDKKSHIWLQDNGVSRDHCKVRWDTYRRIVELVDTSTTGTFVNGTTVKGSRSLLSHADFVRVNGKGKYYDFLVDLRPVFLGFSDPQSDLRQQQQSHKVLQEKTFGLQRRQQMLQTQIMRLEEAIKKREELAFAKEAEYYTLVARRKTRAFEDKQRVEQYEYFLRSSEELKLKLAKSREEWQAKLRSLSLEHEEEERALIETTRLAQEKVDKLQLKQDELDRRAHPDKFAVADLPYIGDLALPPAPDVEIADGFRGTETADEEEQAFDEAPPPPNVSEVADASHTGEQAGAALAEQWEGCARAELPVAQPRPTQDTIEELFGDYDSAEEGPPVTDSPAPKKREAETIDGPGAKHSKTGL